MIQSLYHTVIDKISDVYSIDEKDYEVNIEGDISALYEDWIDEELDQENIQAIAIKMYFVSSWRCVLLKKMIGIYRSFRQDC